MTQLENPKFKNYDNSGVPVGHSYFPGNDISTVTSNTVSLEQARYLHRMHNAAQRQTETYKRNMSRHSSQSKKEMYAESIEDFARANGAVYAGGGEHIIQNQSSVPLGKYVS